MTTTTDNPTKTDAGVAATRSDPAREQRAQWLGLARTMGLDVVGPILLQSQLPKHGWTEVGALMAAASLPLIGVLVDAARGRRLGGLSILVLGGLLLSLVIGLVSGDARMMLLEGALTSLAAAAFCVVTLFTRRTVIELFVGGAAIDGTEQGRRITSWFTRDDVRRLARAVTVVFALVFTLSAIAQVALATWAPIGVAFAYNRFGFLPCLALIAAASYSLWRRARARGELADLA